MTTFAQQRSASLSRAENAWVERKARKYDLRIVDQFYVYCQAVARTHRHRDEALVQSQFATRRAIGSIMLAGGLLCYYLLERITQIVSLL